MKKLSYLFVIISLLTLTGCTLKSQLPSGVQTQEETGVQIQEQTGTQTPAQPKTQAEVEALIQKYADCKQDDDCVGIYGQCPLACHIAINKQYQTIVQDIITTFRNAQSPQCTYKCMEIKKVSCGSDYKCVVE